MFTVGPDHQAARGRPDVAERIAFAHDALRALRPGGRITVLDFGGPASKVGDGRHPTHRHGHSLRRLARLRSRVAPHPMVARHDGEGIVALLADAGFDDVREVAHVDHRFGRVTFVQAARP